MKVNSDITYQAGSSIDLNPGFTVELGAEFSAEIVPCPPTGEWVYQYYLADHLGNNRILFADLDNDGSVDASEVLQENHYYAFGMEMDGDWQSTTEGPEQRYRYNGKEFSEELGLYDYGARWYDPAIGRWTSIDPLADSYAPFSPYNYTLNNPIRFIDPDGMRVDNTIFADEDGNIIYQTVDDLDDAIVVVSNDQKEAFLNASDKLQNEEFVSSGDIEDLRSFGLSYSINGMIEIMNMTEGMELTGKQNPYLTTGGKEASGIHPEFAARIKVTEGKATVDITTADTDEIHDMVSMGGAGPYVHSHPALPSHATRKRHGSGILGVSDGDDSPSAQDRGNHNNRQKVYGNTGLRDAVITPNNIYLYNGNSSKDIKVRRSFFNR